MNLYWHFFVEYDMWKFQWGAFFCCLYLAGIVAFARHARQARSEGTVYNWFVVVTLFLMVGFVICMIFIVQV